MGPDDGPIDLSLPGLDELARQLPNWQRFLFSGFDAPDTRVVPTFWHDSNSNVQIDGGETSFGQSRLIPLPEDAANIPVRAQFLVSTVRPPTGVFSYLVHWEFIRDGQLVDQGVLPLDFTSDSQVYGIFASNPLNPDNINGATPAFPEFLGDVPLRERPVTYVFRARAFVDSDGNMQPSIGDIIDPTPANVYFTVVPTGVSSYIQEPTDEDSQPIKEQEIR
jgi:hypothetical protein